VSLAAGHLSAAVRQTPRVKRQLFFPLSDN
jgi:hypothetical protein